MEPGTATDNKRKARFALLVFSLAVLLDAFTTFIGFSIGIAENNPLVIISGASDVGAASGLILLRVAIIIVLAAIVTMANDGEAARLRKIFVAVATITTVAAFWNALMIVVMTIAK